MIGIPEIIILILGLFIVYLYWAVAKYGKKTSLGFGGALILALFTSPIIAYLIIFFFFPRYDDDDRY